VDLTDYIDSVQGALKGLNDRLRTTVFLTEKERTKLASLMLWCDRVAEKCEDLGEAQK